MCSRTGGFLEQPHPGAKQLYRAQAGGWRACTRDPGKKPNHLLGRDRLVGRWASRELGCCRFGDALHATKPNKAHRHVLIRYPFGTQPGLFGPSMQG